MAMTPQTWSLSALAVEFGMDRRTIANRLRDVEPVGKEGRAKVYRMSDAARAVFSPSGPGGEALDLQQESARLKKSQADKTELEVEVLRGNLIPAEVVAEEWSSQIGAARAKFVGLPSTAAPRVVGLELREVEHELRELVHQALDEMSRYEPRGDTGGERQGRDDAGGRSVGAAAQSDGKRVG